MDRRARAAAVLAWPLLVRRAIFAVVPGAAAALALCGAVAASAPAAASRHATTPRRAEVQPAAAITRGSRLTGALQGSVTVHGTVILTPRDDAALTRFIARVTDPGSAQFGHYLRRGAFATRFGPAPSARRAVTAALRHDGLHVGPSSSSGLLVPFSGTAAQAEHVLRDPDRDRAQRGRRDPRGHHLADHPARRGRRRRDRRHRPRRPAAAALLAGRPPLHDRRQGRGTGPPRGRRPGSPRLPGRGRRGQEVRRADRRPDRLRLRRRRALRGGRHRRRRAHRALRARAFLAVRHRALRHLLLRRRARQADARPRPPAPGARRPAPGDRLRRGVARRRGHPGARPRRLDRRLRRAQHHQ